MTTGINFWDDQVWLFVVELAILLVAMLTANTLRRLIKPLRQSLIPSSVLGGFIVLAADAVWKSISGSSLFTGITLESITYHCLGLGFIAVALKSSGNKGSKKARTDIFNSGVAVVATYLIQGVVGLIITIGLFYLIGSWAASGLLVPMGYGQGPGQAYNWGNIYQNAVDYPAFANGTSFGLTVAAMGFVSASVGGVIYLNIMKRKGRIKRVVEGAEEIEDLSAVNISKKGEIPLSESMDKMTVQVGIVFLTYLGVFLLMSGLSVLFDKLGGFFVGTVKPLIWGFNFLIGVAMGVLVKRVLARLKAANVIHREYTNDFMLSRISGFLFDVMVIASIAAIDLSAFKKTEFIVPLVLVCAAGAVVSYIYVKYVCRRMFPEYSDEAFLAFYGMLTGTASTGVILLREIDPYFETPAANNLVYQQLWAIVFGFPMLLLMGIAPQSTGMTWITLGALAGLFVVMQLILFRGSIFRRKGVKRDEE